MLNDYEWEVDNDTHYMWCKQKCYENEHQMTMCEWYVVNGEMNWWIWNDMSLKMVFVMQVWLIWLSEVCWYIYMCVCVCVYLRYTVIYGECIFYGVDQCEHDGIGETIEIYLTFWMIDIFETDMGK